MNTESVKHFVRSKKFDTLVLVIGIIAAMFIVFHAGVEFGYHRAMFESSEGDSYYKAFGPSDPRKEGTLGSFFDDLSGGHGVAGTIVSVSGQAVTVEDHDGTEKVITIDAGTVIKQLRETVTPASLATGQMIVAIGSPGANGETDAKLIRILPPATASPGDVTASGPTPYQPSSAAAQPQ